MARTQIALGLKGGPFAYIIPPEQFDLHAARKLTQLMIDGAIEVQRTLEPFRVADTVYPQGTDIILMAQPYRAYAKTLLEVQNYPVRRPPGGGPPDRPYDVAGWTLPLQMNVKVDRIDQYFEPPATTRLERAPMPPSQIWGDTRKPAYYVIDGRGNGPSIAINRLLKIGARVAWTTAPLALQGFTYQPGAIVVADGKGVLETVERDCARPWPARHRRGRPRTARHAAAGARAGRALQVLGRKHRRRLDAVAARAVRIPVRDDF